MVAKTFFLVLLGVAFVVAIPVPEVSVNSNALVEKTEERGIKEALKQLESTIHKALEEVKATWEKVKEHGQIIASTNLKNIKEKTLTLLEDAKKITHEIVAEGKEAEPQLKEILGNIKELGIELKHTGIEAVQDAKELIHQIVEALKKKVEELEKSEKQA